MTYKDVNTEKTIVAMPIAKFTGMVVGIILFTTSIVGLFFTKLDKAEFAEFKKDYEFRHENLYKELNDIKVLSHEILGKLEEHLQESHYHKR